MSAPCGLTWTSCMVTVVLSWTSSHAALAKNSGAVAASDVGEAPVQWLYSERMIHVRHGVLVSVSFMLAFTMLHELAFFHMCIVKDRLWDLLRLPVQPAHSQPSFLLVHLRIRLAKHELHPVDASSISAHVFLNTVPIKHMHQVLCSTFAPSDLLHSPSHESRSNVQGRGDGRILA